MEENKKIVILDRDEFTEDLDAIKKEITEIDKLYDEIKTHFDQIKNSHVKTSLTFVEKQTTNLVAIKKTKLDLISARADLKAKLVDMAGKEEQLNLKSNSELSDSGLSESLLKSIRDSFTRPLEPAEVNTDENIDEFLDKQTEEFDVSDILEDKPVIFEQQKQEQIQITVYDKDNNTFYLVDNDFNLLEELGSDVDVIKTYSTVNDEEYAIGQKDDYYPVVSLG